MCEHHRFVPTARTRSIPPSVIMGRQASAINITPRAAEIATSGDVSPIATQIQAKTVQAQVARPAVRVTDTVVKRGPNIEAQKPQIPNTPQAVSQLTRAGVESATRLQEEQLCAVLTRRFQEFRAQEATLPQGGDKKYERRAAKAQMLIAMQRALSIHFLPSDQGKAAQTIRNQLGKRMPTSMPQSEIDALLPNFVLELLKG